MWTASVKNVDKQPNVIYVTIEFTDGTNSFAETYKLYAKPEDPDEWLRRTAQQKINQLDGLVDTTIPEGNIGSWTDPTDPELTALQRALRKLERIKLLVETKVIQETDQRVIDFITLLRSKVDDYWDEL